MLKDPTSMSRRRMFLSMGGGVFFASLARPLISLANNFPMTVPWSDTFSIPPLHRTESVRHVFFPCSTGELVPRIVVIGVGGGGICVVNAMISSGMRGVKFVVVDHDVRALADTFIDRY
jgi:hypothetical protein